MSALPAQRGTRESIVESKERHDPNDRLVPISVAAPILNMSERHLRRLCTDREDVKKYARQIGNKWFIDRVYDPRLAGAHEGMADAEAAAGEQLNKMTGKHRDKAVLRAQILIEFRRARSSDSFVVRRDLPAFIQSAEREYGIKPTKTSLYRWDEQADGAVTLNRIAVMLADASRSSDASRCTPEAWSLFCEYYLDPRQWKISKCHRHVKDAAELHGWAWPGLRWVQMKVKNGDPPADVVAARRFGKKTWERDFKPSAEQDPEAYAVGQCWESDHSVFDFFARVHRRGEWVPTRLWLTAWMDRRTRCLVGWHISESPCTETIKLALLMALNDSWSVPELAWIDNGKDYEAAGLIGVTKDEKRAMKRAAKYWMQESKGKGLLGRLNIEAHFANPYNHNGKARIERMFGTMHMEHDREYDSWCGSKPGEIEDDRKKQILNDVMSLPTIEQVREKFPSWVLWYNTTHDHHVADLADKESGVLLSRQEYYNAHLAEQRVLADPHVLKLLKLKWSREMAVTKHGIGLTIGGRKVNYGSTDPVLQPYKGTDRRVLVAYDPNDMRTVDVFDTREAFIGTVSMNEQMGGFGPLSEKALANHHRQVSKARKRVRDWRPEAPVPENVELGAHAAQRQIDIDETRAKLAEQEGVTKVDTPPLRPVQTQLDGQHDEIESQEYQQAVGGEFEGSGQEYNLIDALLDADEPTSRLSDSGAFTIDDMLGDEPEPNDSEDNSGPASFSILEEMERRDRGAGPSARPLRYELIEPADEGGDGVTPQAGRDPRATGGSMTTDGLLTQSTDAHSERDVSDGQGI